MSDADDFSPGRGDSYGSRSAFAAPQRLPRLHRAVPVVRAVSNYDGGLLRKDILAGLTVGALALPSGMAFAQLAGLPPVVGLYALLLPAIAYFLLGSSRQLIVGPEGTTATLTAATLAPLALGDPTRYIAMALTLTFLVGVIFVLVWILRLGWVADYFSRAVLVGYITGVAITLIVGQLAKFTGVDITGDSALQEMVSFFENLDTFDLDVTIIGLVALAALLLLRRFLPKLPGSLLVVIAGVIFGSIADLPAWEVPTIGDIPAGLPSLAMPELSWSDLSALLPGAMGIFLVSFGDIILTARTFASKHGQHVRPDQEMLALGAANLASSVTGGMPISASGSRTAVNDESGAHTQIAGLVGAGFILVVLLFLTGPMANLPSTVLGAVIVAAAIGLIEPHEWGLLSRLSRVELGITAVTTIGVLTLGVLQSLIIAVALSFVDVVVRSARPHDAVLGHVSGIGRWVDVAGHPDATVISGIVVYRLDDRLFFANAGRVNRRVQEAVRGAPAPVRHLVFDGEDVSNIDAPGVDSFGELIDELDHLGVELWLARARQPVIGALRSSGLIDRMGDDHVHDTVEGAIAAVERVLAQG